ncbi:stage II sporulation protein M [Hellea sp.]|nr:stage II sporulation protein M [Hellea sp.]
MVGQMTLKSHRFRTEREQSWRELETILKAIEGRGMKSLSDDQIVALPRLYRSTLSSLSVARVTSLDQGVIVYLESLSARAYYILYGSQVSLGKRISTFFLRDWPLAAKALWKETAISAALTLLAAVLAFILVKNNPDWFYTFMPESMADGRTPAASAETLRETLYHEGGSDGLGIFASFLFSHNSKVAMFAFALGFAFCIPTAILLLYNGFILGSFIAVFSEKSLGFEVGGWLIIHGATEIFAIILAGAAGMHIGKVVAFPGELTRTESASKAGGTASLLMAGVVIMLFFAGLLEGFGRQLVTNDLVRYGIGLGTLSIWLLYFYGPRRVEDQV